jgi:diguanylate cyclase (GGDEF)-like protein
LATNTAEEFTPNKSDPPSDALLHAQQEIVRLSDQLKSKNRSMAQACDFLRGALPSLDSQKVYGLALAKLSEIMGASRSSLMILSADSKQLALKAVHGVDFDAAEQVRINFGEGIAGGVFASGEPLVVADVDSDPRVPRVRRSGYRSKSFISYPITLGARKIGVINLTDRLNGVTYNTDDLPLLELIGAQLALIIDSTEWRRKADAYQRMSLTDALTGLPNRRYLEERLFEEVERSKRHATPLSFMIIDVDCFKRYNDIFGHTNADQVLIKTAQLLRRSVRAIDMTARFAGDEFCIVLPETELFAAARIAERLRKTISYTEYRSEQGEMMGRVTISIGVSSLGASRQNPIEIIETADRALYCAKTRGRDCVAVCEDSIGKD